MVAKQAHNTVSFREQNEMIIIHLLTLQYGIAIIND